MKYFTKNLKKKSPQRRARIRRNRGVIRKRSLSDSLKREFKNLRRYNLPGDKIDNKKQKIYLSFNSSINSESSRDGLFKEGIYKDVVNNENNVLETKTCKIFKNFVNIENVVAQS
jgi:hypothetical protein